MEENRVRFNNEYQYFSITENKEYNYNEEYEKRYVNRRLAKMERYFRKHNLLEKTEMLDMLDMSDFHQKHIRLPFIEYIAYRNGWIEPNESLTILTK